MNAERLELLQKRIKKLDIDVENGLILNKAVAMLNGRPAIRWKVNYKIKWYHVHEVIAVAGGLDILNMTVDHVNGNKLDNRLANLESVTLAENSRRQKEQGNLNIEALRANAKLANAARWKNRQD